MRYALQTAAFVACAAMASAAVAHDCRVRDIAGYLKGNYEGECNKNEIAHGQGEAKGADSYVGTFVDGWPEGKGTYVWENGAKLDGTFKRGLAHGPGVYVSAKGVRYEADFADGRLTASKAEDCPVTPGPLSCKK